MIDLNDIVVTNDICNLSLLLILYNNYFITSKYCLKFPMIRWFDNTIIQRKKLPLRDDVMPLNKTRLSRIFMLVIGNNNWRRRWLDFRNGHSIYLIFLMTFANFVTIQYRLLIDRAPVVHSIFSSIWIFALVFIAIYVPLGMAIGYWHRKSQFSVEAEALFSQNQIGATIYLFLIDLIDGKVTEEEKQSMRNYLMKIMKRNSPPSVNGNVDINKSSQAEPKMNAERAE